MAKSPFAPARRELHRGWSRGNARAGKQHYWIVTEDATGHVLAEAVCSGDVFQGYWPLTNEQSDHARCPKCMKCEAT